jgi:hypothetical protein
VGTGGQGYGGAAAFREALANYHEALKLLDVMPDSPERDVRELALRHAALIVLLLIREAVRRKLWTRPDALVALASCRSRRRSSDSRARARPPGLSAFSAPSSRAPRSTLQRGSSFSERPDLDDFSRLIAILAFGVASSNAYELGRAALRRERQGKIR